jgi:hypothetical protein
MSFLNIMSFINIFYNTKEIHKLLIRQSYNDIKDETDNFKNDDTQTELQHREKIRKLIKIFINNLLNYCKNYPHDKISKNRFINEYNEYPYRLEQNISEVILDL